MLVQRHKGCEKDAKRGCFAVGKSKEEIFTDLSNYAKEHPNDNVYFYVYPVRFNDENYMPEYMMEIELTNSDEKDFKLWAFDWSQYQ